MILISVNRRKWLEYIRFPENIYAKNPVKMTKTVNYVNGFSNSVKELNKISITFQ